MKIITDEDYYRRKLLPTKIITNDEIITDEDYYRRKLLLRKIITE